LREKKRGKSCPLSLSLLGKVKEEDGEAVTYEGKKRKMILPSIHYFRLYWRGVKRRDRLPPEWAAMEEKRVRSIVLVS